MKVLLIYPPWSLEEEFGKLAEVGNLQQPLGIGYLGAVLEKEGYEVKIIDAPPLGYSISQIIDGAREFGPDVVGISCVTADFYKAKKMALEIEKEIDCPIILGGAHLTATPYEAMSERCFDFGVVGEGEITLLELLKEMKKGKSGNFESVRGIIFRRDGKIIRRLARPFIENLDTIPFPARHLMPSLSLYHPTPASYKKLPVASMITSRGCPFQCVFCDRAIFGNVYRFRSPKNVVDEMEVLIKDFGAGEIRFWDDTFNFYPKRVIEICKAILKRKIEIPWTCLGRVNFIQDEMLRWMKKAGCWQISFGIESGNEEILKKIKKSITKEMVRQALSKTKKAGIRTRGFFMLGLPGETVKTMQDTIDFAKSLPLDVAGFYVTIPFPNTELYQKAKERGELVNPDYSEYLMNFPEKIFYLPKGLKEEVIFDYLNKAYREFYFRPKFLVKQLVQIRRWQELVAKFKAFLAIKKV